MSKNKHGDLFNTSLTEIIIILFFVLMLFALFNIDKVNQENVGLGDEIDSLISDKVILEENNQTLEEIVNVKDDPASLAPINVELAQQISDLKKENRELEKEIERLSPADLIDVPPEPLIEPDEESLIAGNCIDKKFWRQCAEWAWPLASTPPYEYLFDIGMCSSGSIVVIESAWNEKKEMDFILVNGASTITDKATGNPIDAYAIYKSKKKWSTSGSSWEVPTGDIFYNKEKIIDYVVDMEFVPINEKGLKINPPPTATNANKDKIYQIKIVDIILTTRSSKPYFRTKIAQTIYALADSNRNISKSDKYLRDSVVVSAHARNLGLN